MKAVVTRTIAVVGALVVLVAVNGSIIAKERIKTHGERIYLELLPVDPRSLMQGDYMALRFSLAESIPATGSGSAPLLIDERGVATLNPDSRASGLRIRYRVRNERVWLGTNAYFFEEGAAQHFARARYGEFRVDRASGEAVLVALRGPELEELRGAVAGP
jgi:uncharacterized membrane-anchored protein